MKQSIFTPLCEITCFFDVSPLSAFDLRGYFDVFMQLIVKITGIVF